MDIQVDDIRDMMRTQKIIEHGKHSKPITKYRVYQLGLSYPLEGSKPAQAEMQQKLCAYVCNL